MIIGGAGGHALEILSLFRELAGGQVLAFFDENPDVESFIDQIPVYKTSQDILKLIKSKPEFCLGIGSPATREKFDRFFTAQGGILKPIISTTSIIQSDTSFADVMSFGFVGPKVSLGRGVLVNTRASVHHGCVVGDYSEIGPGAILLGDAKIGKKCRIGAGAIILPGITLGDEVVVGAGAVVTKSIMSKSTVVGVPAKPI